MFAHPPAHHHTVAQPPVQQPEVAPKPRFLFKMPRVVPNQKEKFESDEFLKRHSRDGEVSSPVLATPGGGGPMVPDKIFGIPVARRFQSCRDSAGDTTR
jgi:hypothetical protein